MTDSTLKASAAKAKSSTAKKAPAELAARHKVHVASVVSILRGKTWGHLTGITKRHRNGFAPPKSNVIKIVIRPKPAPAINSTAAAA